MAFLFRPITVSYRDEKGKKCNMMEAVVLDENGRPVLELYKPKRGKPRVHAKLRPGCRQVVEKSTKWYGRIKGPDGKLRPVPLHEDKGLAEEIYAQKNLEASRKRHGLIWYICGGYIDDGPLQRASTAR
jgi:hypothetical protein